MEPEALQLRDIHLPEPVGWWPPAPGWWGVLVSIVVVVMLVAWLRRRWMRRAPLREINALLRQLQQQDQSGDPQQLLVTTSALLRRALRHRYPHEGIETLTGTEWLQRLDAESGSSQYTQGAGSILGSGPYQQQAEYDPQALVALVSDTARRVVRGGI